MDLFETVYQVINRRATSLTHGVTPDDPAHLRLSLPSHHTPVPPRCCTRSLPDCVSSMPDFPALFLKPIPCFRPRLFQTPSRLAPALVNHFVFLPDPSLCLLHGFHLPDSPSSDLFPPVVSSKK